MRQWHHNFQRLVLSLVLAIFWGGNVCSAAVIYKSQDRIHPVVGSKAMVAVQEARAANVGLAILEKGGNACDAAVAVGFAIAVTLPRAGNLGGGGFMMVYEHQPQRVSAIDYRETAPKLAQRDMFLDANGDVDSKLSRDSVLSSGTPGTVAGLILTWKRCGSQPIEALIDPAIELAEKGFVVRADLVDSLARYESRLSDEAKSVFFPNGEPLKVGDVLIQSDLAWSLKQIRKNPDNAFYRGEIAQRFERFMVENGGVMRRSDLMNYRAELRQPIRGTYRGVEIATFPPPSSGGIHLVQMLNILESFPLSEYGLLSANSIHVMAEAMRLAYADRSQFLGDPDFVTVPQDTLISKDYAQRLAQRISLDRVAVSEDIKPGTYFVPESTQTTHFSIVDQYGNMVSNTTTLNFAYGSGKMVPGTGILLNNEMDDFSSKPGVPNAYGLVGGEANAIAPNKRMLSSMTPTFVFKDGAPLMVTGSPGGSRIITTVLQMIVNVVDFDQTIAQATIYPRFHHQWLPDKLFVESGISPDTLSLLRKRGHVISQRPAMGSTQSIMITDQGVFGSSDPRRPGALSVGF